MANKTQSMVFTENLVASVEGQDCFARQRKIVREEFQKLRDRFLTKEQNLIVYLEEQPEDYWSKEKPQSAGFTDPHSPYDCIEKVSCIYVYIRFFYGHEDLYNLLHTIAHEFAHVYLIFNNPTKYGHTVEHATWKEYFFNFLINNYW